MQILCKYVESVNKRIYMRLLNSDAGRRYCPHAATSSLIHWPQRLSWSQRRGGGNGLDTIRMSSARSEWKINGSGHHYDAIGLPPGRPHTTGPGLSPDQTAGLSTLMKIYETVQSPGSRWRRARIGEAFNGVCFVDCQRSLWTCALNPRMLATIKTNSIFYFTFFFGGKVAVNQPYSELWTISFPVICKIRFHLMQRLNL